MTEQNNDASKTNATVGLAAGTRIGKYEVVERVGAGGQSIVYKCLDKLLNRFVAIKQISSHLVDDERFVKRFRAEAQILAQLGGEQSNIVAVYDLIEHELGLFIAMEYIDGHALSRVLSYQEQALPVDIAVDILLGVAHGLKIAHAEGIVHRDIKPSNVMITRDHSAKIADFGVAARAGQDDSLSLGTTKYMAPEVFAGSVIDERVDVYSLGFLAYEMLTGREFFRNVFHEVVCDPHTENLRWMKWHSDLGTVAPILTEINPLVGASLGQCVATMMAKNPGQRFASMTDVIASLRAVKAELAHPESEPVADVAVAATDLERVAEAAATMSELPTSVVPRRPIRTRTKVILAVSIVSALITTGIVLAIVAGSRQRQRKQEAAVAFEAVERGYAEGERLYAVEGDVAGAIDTFTEAATGFSRHGVDYGDLPAGSRRAEAMALMSEAYVAMLSGRMDEADDFLAVAKDLDALLTTAIDPISRSLTSRKNAIACLDGLATAIAAKSLTVADTKANQFAGMARPPLDQNLRAIDLTKQLAQAHLERRITEAFSLGDAAIDSAEVSAAADDAAKFAEARSHLDRAADAYQKALGLRNSDAVQQRFGVLKQARGFVEARAAYVVVTEAGASLGERVAALKAVVASRPPSVALIEEMAVLSAETAEEAYQRAAALIASGGDETTLLAAKAALDASIAFAPTPEAVASLKQVVSRIAMLGWVAQANDAIDTGRLADAAGLLARAGEAAEGEPVGPELSAAQVRLHVANGDDAVRKRSWTVARAYYEKAREVRLDDEALSGWVDVRTDIVERHERFYAHLAEGRRLLATSDYSDARGRFRQAERQATELATLLAEQFSEREWSALAVEVDVAVAEGVRALYLWDIAKGKAAEANGDLRYARECYRMAKGRLDKDGPGATEEVDELIRQIEGRLK